MRVADLMRGPVVTIHRDALVREAITLFADQRVSALPVVDAGGNPIGTLSTTDVLQAAAEAGDPGARDVLLDHTRVEELMTKRVFTIAANEDISEAAKQLLYADVHRLFVTDNGRLAGVLSVSDLTRALIR